MAITKSQCRQKTLSMLRNAMKDMTEKIEKALSCGALNLDNYDDNYELPRIIASAVLKDAAYNYGPLTSDNRKEASNLYHFL